MHKTIQFFKKLYQTPKHGKQFKRWNIVAEKMALEGEAESRIQDMPRTVFNMGRGRLW